MSAKRSGVSESDFIRLFESLGPANMAVELGVTQRSILSRRRRIEEKTGKLILNPADRLQARGPGSSVRKTIDIQNGTIIVGSDAHYWQDVSTAHAAFVEVCKYVNPDIVVANGDMLDGASISRHPPINWEGVPSLIEEIGYCQTRLDEIVKASPSAKHYWPVGNHDLRFEAKLASVAPEFKGVPGVHLKDHFPAWTPCMSLWVNDDLVIKHRYKGGLHARHNNTLSSGKSMITGHTHQQGCTPFTDYNGTRYGIEAGTMAETYGVQFEYTEDGPRNWIQGFVLVHFVDGRLMMPEFVSVVDVGKYEFRGEVHEVSL